MLLFMVWAEAITEPKAMFWAEMKGKFLSPTVKRRSKIKSTVTWFNSPTIYVLCKELLNSIMKS